MTQAEFTTLVATLGSCFVAFIGYLGIRAEIGRRRRRNAKGLTQGYDSATAYQDDPGQFIQDVLTDNRAKNEEMREMRRDMEEIRRELNKVKEDLSNEIITRGAFSRWIMDISNAWGKVTEMPKPRESDRSILNKLLPDTNKN